MKYLNYFSEYYLLIASKIQLKMIYIGIFARIFNISSFKWK
jgi:hypothetical protein